MGVSQFNLYCDTFSQAYEKMVHELIFFPHYQTKPRGQKINEILNARIEIKVPQSNLFENGYRNIPLKYLANELILYFKGSNDATDFGNASKFWNNIKNDDGTVNSAYGHLIFRQQNDAMWTQWEWAKQSLLQDKDSRQAIMHYNNPKHQYGGVKDFPCTLDSQFFIRNDELSLTTHMRSNDVFFGVTYDFPFFMLLMQCMRLELLHKYPNLTLGSYTHIAGSLHAYERDFDDLESMLEHDFKPIAMPILEINPILHENIFRAYRDDEPYDDFCKWLWVNK